jgi:thiol-disulfide isomerase/thioredoxin
MRFFTWAVAALCFLVAGAALAESDIKPWRGKATLPLVGNDTEGRAVDLKAMQGRVLVVNFWATWCEPCRDEMPSLARLQEKLKGKPFEVLAVNYGESRSKVADFVRKEGWSIAVLLDPEKQAADAWGAKGLPMTFLVDATGRVRYSTFGERDWSEGEGLAAVEALLAEAPRAR